MVNIVRGRIMTKLVLDNWTTWPDARVICQRKRYLPLLKPRVIRGTPAKVGELAPTTKLAKVSGVPATNSRTFRGSPR